MGLRGLSIILAIALLVLILIPSSIAESPKTDVKIITHLEGGGFLTPALSENNTFVYDRFQFHLYSNTNNTTYRIIVDNITIANLVIVNFKDIFYWRCSKSFIGLLEVYIADDYYNYSSIFVFTSDITNGSILREEEKYKVFTTKKEFEDFIMGIELQAVGKAIVGGFVAIYITYKVTKKRKEEIIKRIA